MTKSIFLVLLILSISKSSIISGGDFEGDVSKWRVVVHEDVPESAYRVTYQSTSNVYDGEYSLKVEILEAQEEAWHIQLLFPELPLQKSTIYNISLAAAGDAPVGISVTRRGDWSYKEGFSLNLAPEYQLFSGEFSSDENTYWGDLRVFITMGQNEGTYYFDNIEVNEVRSIDTTQQWYLQADKRIDSIRRGDFSLSLLSPSGESLENYSIEVDLKRHEFLFGTAINFKTVAAEDMEWYKESILKHFNSVVTENALKWVDFEPNPGQLDTAHFRSYTDFAEENQLYLRGHTLAWGLQAYGFESHWPNFLDCNDLGEALRGRIERDLRHFSGKIDEYDVWNEPLHETAFFQRCAPAGTPQYYKLLDSAFHWAREADPEAMLFMNEYNILTGGSTHMYRDLALAMLDRGVPIDGLGVQGHFTTNRPNPDLMKHRLDILAETGLPIRITEFDMGLPYEGLTLDEKTMAKSYMTALRTAFSHPAVEGFFLWGFWDGTHWVGPAGGNHGAGIYRLDKTPKPIADSLLNIWGDEWHTNHKEILSGNSTNFRGFYGFYNIKAVSPNGEDTLIGSVRLTPENMSYRVTLQSDEVSIVGDSPSPINLDNLKMFQSGSGFHYQLLGASEAKVSIYSISGQLISAQTIQPGQIGVIPPPSARGIYLLQTDIAGEAKAIIFRN